MGKGAYNKSTRKQLQVPRPHIKARWKKSICDCSTPTENWDRRSPEGSMACHTQWTNTTGEGGERHLKISSGLHTRTVAHTYPHLHTRTHPHTVHTYTQTVFPFSDEGDISIFHKWVITGCILLFFQLPGKFYNRGSHFHSEVETQTTA